MKGDNEMRWTILGILTVILTLLQGSLIPTLTIGQMPFHPQLLLIVMVMLAIEAPAEQALVMAFILGLETDLISVTIGPHTLGFTLCAMALIRIRRIFSLVCVTYRMLSVLCAGLVIHVMVHFFIPIKGHTPAGLSDRYVLMSILTSCFFSPVLFLALKPLLPNPWRYNPSATRPA